MNDNTTDMHRLRGGLVHSQKCLYTYIHLKTPARNKMAANITLFNPLTWLMQPLVDVTSHGPSLGFVVVGAS